MRIISGKARGSRIVAPKGWKTRPPTARVRASIFSRIASRMDIEGAEVLDLFAGSGSFGIEALSRGAGRATFVDTARETAAIIQRNLEELQLAERATIVTADVFRALAGLARARAQYDLVFVDPPFAADTSGNILAKVASLDLLKRHGMVIVRQFYRAPELDAAEYARVNMAKIGDHRIALYRRLAAEVTGAPEHGE